MGFETTGMSTHGAESFWDIYVRPQYKSCAVLVLCLGYPQDSFHWTQHSCFVFVRSRIQISASRQTTLNKNSRDYLQFSCCFPQSFLENVGWVPQEQIIAVSSYLLINLLYTLVRAVAVASGARTYTRNGRAEYAGAMTWKEASKVKLCYWSNSVTGSLNRKMA